MHPFLLLLLAIVTPFLILTVLLLPPYAGMYGAAYLIYDTGHGPSPLAGHFLDVFYIVDVFSKLFHYWLANRDALSIVHYTLPVVALPAAGLLIALWTARRVIRKLVDVFHLSS